MQVDNIEEIKNDLLIKKKDLEDRLLKIKNNKTKVSGPLAPNSTEQAVELQSKDVIDALDNIEHQELEQVEAALKQIDGGRYGICITCLEGISPSRLRALPHARNCIECVNEVEQ